MDLDAGPVKLHKYFNLPKLANAHNTTTTTTTTTFSNHSYIYLFNF